MRSPLITFFDQNIGRFLLLHLPVPATCPAHNIVAATSKYDSHVNFSLTSSLFSTNAIFGALFPQTLHFGFSPAAN